MSSIFPDNPIFVIIDALDECPSDTGTPSAREEVLDFLESLVGSNHSSLFLCITSHPEQEIQAVLNPLTSALHRVSLHEEVGQWEDVNSYVHSFVRKDSNAEMENGGQATRHHDAL